MHSSHRAFPAIRAIPVIPALLALSLTACIFDTEPTAPYRPPTTFDFSRLDSLPNPFSRWLPAVGDKSMVGIKFAFRTVQYEKEVDSNIAAFAVEAGGKPALAGAYFDLSSRPQNITRFLKAVDAHGAIPFVTLDPKDWDEPDIGYQRSFIRLLIEGKFDASLLAQAKVLAAFGKPVAFRFGHEMNGNWYPYGGVFIGGDKDADGDGRADGPANFVKAWRRVHGIFAAAGADKLLWIFCPNWESFPNREWNRPFAYYPGSEYVDFISMDTYESPDKRARSLASLVDSAFEEMGHFFQTRASAPEFALRPFGLSEFGTWRKDAGAKGDWYAAGLRALAGDDRIRFHVLYNAQNGSKDFSITGLGEKLREAYASSRFQFSFLEALARARGLLVAWTPGSRSELTLREQSE